MGEQQKENKCLFVALGALIIFLFLIFIFSNVAQAQLNCWGNCWQSCGPQEGTYIVDSCCPAPFNDTCIGHSEGFRMGYCQYSYPPSCAENDSWLDCPDGTRIWSDTYLASWSNGICTSAIEDCLGKQCYCFEQRGGDCSGGNGGDTNGQVELRNLTCPNVCYPGQTFDVSYEYRSANYTGLVELGRRFFIWGLNPETGFIYWLHPQSFGYQVLYNFNSPSDWQTHTVSIGCDELENADSNVRVNAYNRDSNSGYDWGLWGNNASGGDYDSVASCTVERVTSLGFLRAQSIAGIIKLNLISVANAISAGNGVIKVQTASGVAAADLVATTDSNASPVRIMTPQGIRAWRKRF